MILRISLAAILLLPTAALAQGDPGPFGGLFGRTPERTGAEFTAVEFRNGYAAQYDDAILVDDALPEDEVPRSGYTAGVNAGLVFERQTDRLMLKTQGGATYQEFYREPVFGSTSYDALAMARGRVTNRIDLEGAARYGRSPFYRFAPSIQLDSPVVVPGDPFIVRMQTSQTYDVSGGLVSRYAKHSSLQFTAMQRETLYGDTTGDLRFKVQGFQGRWRRQIKRSFGVHLGYGQERVSHSSAPDTRYVYELIDAGVDFQRQLSLARRTSLAVTTQTTAVKRPLTGRRYRLQGSATLTSYFAKTWRVAAGVSRNTEFIPGFFEPLFSDSVNAMVGGMVSKRSEWINTVSGGVGRFGLDGSGRYKTANLTSRVNWALTRYFGIFGQYAVYYHRLPETPTAFVLPNQISRQAITIGLNTWIPILNNVRAPRDPE